MKPLLLNTLSVTTGGRNSLSSCHGGSKPCVRWVQRYFKDCLCNLSDDFSFAFGLVSLVSWGVAEIPQIITNFRTKSGHGVSVLFLLTWVLGDVFNLAGCLLEPATLPTQYYTAVLYTASTLVLVFQSLYYDYLYSWCNFRQGKNKHTQQDEEEEHKRPLNADDKGDGQGGIPIPTPTRRSAIPRRQSAQAQFYFTSARSLASSSTPPFRSYLVSAAKSGPSAVGWRDDNFSSDDEGEDDSASTAPGGVRGSKPISIPRSVARGAALVASANLPLQGNAMGLVYKGLTARKLLQESEFEHSALGQWLGWMMAAIYMGGRIPQIVLNIKRGSVEGLNPLMFVFALIANVSYVASILVRSTEWARIKANMPWLLDAVVCVALDLFIIMQYVYYMYMHKKKSSEENGYYVEADCKESAF